MKTRRTYYEIMGVANTAAPDEIREKFFELARKFHPDRAPKSMSAAQRLFAQINVAYSTLRHPESRAAYDKSLSTGRPYKDPAADSSISNVAIGDVVASTSADHLAIRSTSESTSPADSKQSEAIAAANAAYMRSDLKGALAICLQIINLEPGNCEAHSLTGDIYQSLRRPAEALDEYRALIAAIDGNRQILEKIRRIELQLAAKNEGATRPITSKPAPNPPKTAKQSLFGKLIPHK